MKKFGKLRKKMIPGFDYHEISVFGFGYANAS